MIQHDRKAHPARHAGSKPFGSHRHSSGQAAQGKPTTALQKQNYVGTKENTLKIIPLGGMEEVGRNMTVFEYAGDIVILDMGLQFPEEDMPGIDYVIPNTEYLKGKE